MFETYDVIVVGAGHAGCEAAAAAASLGSKVLLVTMNLQTIAQMSCNPAMGGIAKGQIVREIDALGGYSGIVTDRSTIQFRMLNRSKGPGMWSPRAQCDRHLFAATWRQQLENIGNVHFLQDSVRELIVSRGTLQGVRTVLGANVRAGAVIITSGTFLNGAIHIGQQQMSGGRMGEAKAVGLTEQLVTLGFETDRLKTGTPPRVDGRSLDYTKMEVQEGDSEVTGFSYLPIKKVRPEEQRVCWIAHTNEVVHDIMRTGFDQSPMYTGRIEGTGPRYCPSVEDKVSRFADKTSHQLFVEPEGWNTVEIYVNGFSTSLPADVQMRALRAVPGFEQCRFFRPGYAIEYDYFPPTQLTSTLETKPVRNLFFAGQINGTTGYEEAACQGLMAGINAHLAVTGRDPFVLRRNEAYIGVLIDDLVSKGTDEPYRMFTSRAEYRTLLRQDNADLRLTAKSYGLGLASDERLALVQEKETAVCAIQTLLAATSVEPGDINGWLEAMSTAPVSERVRVQKLLLRPAVSLAGLATAIPSLAQALRPYSTETLQQAEIQIKYESYIQKEQATAKRMTELEDLHIPTDFNFERIGAMSTEARQKLSRIRPSTLGQASRVSGVNPSDVQILMVHLGR